MDISKLFRGKQNADPPLSRKIGATYPWARLGNTFEQTREIEDKYAAIRFRDIPDLSILISQSQWLDHNLNVVDVAKPHHKQTQQ